MSTGLIVDTDMPTSAGIRIALVAPDMAILGGQGVQAQQLYNRLSDAGHTVTFIPVNPTFPTGMRWVRRVPYLRTLLNQLLYLPGLLRMRDADVVHVYSASYWSFLLAPVPAMLVARFLGKHVVLNYHSGEAQDHLDRWGRRVHPWLRLADDIVVPSAYLRDVFTRHRYPSHIIRNIVDTSAFKYRQRTRLQPRILSVRNLETHYRIDVTIKAFALFKRHYPDATLMIVGYGSQEKKLRELAKSENCGGITFTGRIEQADMPEIYDQADVFVNSSVIDNQPVSILEAFAAGLVVVTTGTGDISTMVKDKYSGYLVPSNDPETLANTLISVLTCPEQALQVAENASDEVKKYAWPYVCNDWTSVYMKVNSDESATHS